MSGEDRAGDPPGQRQKWQPRACQIGDLLRLVAPIDTERKWGGPVTHTEPNGQVYKACRLIGAGWDFRLIQGQGPNPLRIVDDNVPQFMKLIPRAEAPELYAIAASTEGEDELWDPNRLDPEEYECQPGDLLELVDPLDITDEDYTRVTHRLRPPGVFYRVDRLEGVQWILNRVAGDGPDTMPLYNDAIPSFFRVHRPLPQGPTGE